MTWEDQLLTKEWATKRTEILIRDHFKCQYPGCGRQFWCIEVHHIDYIFGTLAWEYPNDMLKSLCHEHHADHHEGIKAAEKALMTTALSSLVDTDRSFAKTLLKTLASYQDGQEINRHGEMEG